MSVSYFEWAQLGTIAIGGGFALWKYFDELRWRRQRFASDLWANFASKKHNKNAMIMLDWIRKIELELPGQKDPVYERVATSDLISALQTNAPNLTFTPKHVAIRDIFDLFLTDLTEIEHHIDRGLISFEQIRPYLIYWLRAMTGQGHVQHVGLPTQLGAFIDAYEYQPVKRLCGRAGLRFPNGKI